MRKDVQRGAEPRKSSVVAVPHASGATIKKRSVVLSDAFVPSCFRITDSGNLLLVNFSRAQYVLIDVLEGEYENCDITYDYYGSCVSAKVLTLQKRAYVYFKVDQTLYPRTKQISGVLSRHFLGTFEGYFNDWLSLDNVFIGLDKAKKKQWWDETELEDLPKAKISGSHHIHYTAQEVWDVLSWEEKEKARQAFRLPREITTTMMAGTMLWLVSLNDALYERIIKTALLDQPDMVSFAKFAKVISVRAKSYQNIVADDLRMIFEIDVLVNRDVGEVDWVGEKRNRTVPNLANISTKRIYELAAAMMVRPDTTKERPRRFEWEKFWNARWQWSAAGSVHSQYPEDTINLPKERELKNKFIALSLLPKLPFSYFNEREPTIEAWSSVKYEWGKMRAIYGTDLTSYVMAHFAFYNIEDTLPNEFPVGSKARPSYVRSKVGAVLKDSLALCIDFEDFNSQHSYPAMKAVLQAYLDVNHKYLSDDQKQAVAWTMESIEKTRVHDNMGTGTSYNATGTLMSGWRLTTYVNSVLNYIYSQLLLEGGTSMVNSVHNGDDVLMGVKNFDVTRRAVYNADKYNIRLQRSKCAFGGIAEFLRVDRVRGDYGQYLTRNIATLMHSRIESKVALCVTDVVEANDERLREFIQRGGSPKMAAKLKYTYLSRISEIFNTSVKDCYMVSQIHRVMGGTSDSPDALLTYKVEKEKGQSNHTLPEKLPGVADYAMQLKETLELDVPIEKISERVYSATLNAVQLVRTAVKVVPNDDMQQAVVYRALYKAHGDVSQMPTFGKALLTGFVFDVLTSNPKLKVLTNILSSSKDPMAFLKVIT